MNWFCLTCGNETLKKRGRSTVWCSWCERLSMADDISMAWYAAEWKRHMAGRPLPKDYAHGDQA